MDITLNAYLNFEGNAGEAMRFYHSVLGGELIVQTFGEAKMARSPSEEHLVVHARLNSGAITLMASDAPAGMKTQFGNNVHLSLMGGDSERLTAIFGALAKEGKVDMPLAKQFWGDTYGQLTDRNGVHWMVNIAASPSQ